MAARIGVDIAPRAIFGKPEMPDFRAFKADGRDVRFEPEYFSEALTSGAEGLDDRDGGLNAAFDVQI
jgi:hypothetical protein